MPPPLLRPLALAAGLAQQQQQQRPAQPPEEKHREGHYAAEARRAVQTGLLQAPATRSREDQPRRLISQNVRARFSVWLRGSKAKAAARRAVVDEARGSVPRSPSGSQVARRGSRADRYRKRRLTIPAWIGPIRAGSRAADGHTSTAPTIGKGDTSE